MLRRCWGLAIVGIFAFTGLPAWGQTYNKDAVRALSKRIDEHLAKTWKKAKVTPAPKANDHVFFRRLNLDLAGRIPDLIDLADFHDQGEARWGLVDKLLAGAMPDLTDVGYFLDETDPRRWLWVDRLLDDPRYQHSRHFGNVWRNLILGNQTNVQFQFLMPGFESWLRERVEKNVPLDQTVLELLTSQAGNPNQGFDGRMVASSPQLFFQVNENKAENLAGATSRLFLGVKIECAQCHAHPFAKWSKEQFWEFAAFYSAQQQVAKRKILKDGPAPQPGFSPGREILIPGTDKVVRAKFLNGKEPNWEGSNNPRRTLAEWVTAKDNPYFAKAMADHLWSYLMGVSLLEPILEPSDDSPITHPELLNDLAKGLIDNNFDAKFLIRAIVHSDAYQRSSGGAKLADKEDYQLFVRMPMRAMSPEQIFDSVWMVTNPKDRQPDMPNQQFFNPNQAQSDRAKFLNKFQTQDRRHEPQTSILQALFMMNGEFITKRTKLENNEALQTLAAQKTSHEKRLRSLFMIVLSRPPRDSEIERLMPYLERGAANNKLGEALSDVYWALLNSSEFLLNH
jgi:hypothetical protein